MLKNCITCGRMTLTSLENVPVCRRPSCYNNILPFINPSASITPVIQWDIVHHPMLGVSRLYWQKVYSPTKENGGDIHRLYSAEYELEHLKSLTKGTMIMNLRYADA